MSECCNDGTKGSYKPARKIVVPKAKIVMIIDERMRKNVAFKGITELGSILGPNLYFFSADDKYAAEFCEAAKNYPDTRMNLLCATSPKADEFVVYACYKGKVTLSPKNYLLGEDVCPTFKQEDLLYSFSDILAKNKVSFIPLKVCDMLILKSIMGVQPYDLLLAKHYLLQYTNARQALKPEDMDLVLKIKETGMPTLDDNYNDEVKAFLRIERKLFSAYAH